ncbi:MAG: hypothetical protein AAFY57_09225 [Cyanobacteria bacterium J06642_2]
MVKTDADKETSILVSLPDEELSKVPAVSDEWIKQALEKGRKERVAAEASARPLPTNSRILFR